MPDQGTGVKIAFGTSNFVAKIVDINQVGITRPPVETTHSETADGSNDPSLGEGPNTRTFDPSDLIDEGEYDLEIHYEAHRTIPYKAGKETITVTVPRASNHTANGTYVFPGFITSHDKNFAPLEAQTMRARIRLKVAGAVNFTPAEPSS